MISSDVDKFQDTISQRHIIKPFMFTDVELAISSSWCHFVGNSIERVDGHLGLFHFLILKSSEIEKYRYKHQVPYGLLGPLAQVSDGVCYQEARLETYHSSISRELQTLSRSSSREASEPLTSVLQDQVEPSSLHSSFQASSFRLTASCGASKMAQSVKVLAAKTDDLSTIPQTHKVEGENNS
ncbi:hypothetical protein STEG23_036574 [Scotinomys teguina]